MNLRTIIPVGILVLSSLIPAATKAQTSIYDNYRYTNATTPLPGYSTSSVTNVSKNNSVALSFTVTQQFNMLTFDMPLALTAAGTLPITLKLEANVSSAPSGTSLFTPLTQNVTSTTPGIFTFAANPTFSLNPGIYWVVLESSDNHGLNWFSTNDTSFKGYATQNGNSAWDSASHTSLTSPALRVRGNPVPEFGSVWTLSGLLLSGGAGLWWQNRLRRIVRRKGAKPEPQS